jgi:hypothetical protein
VATAEDKPTSGKPQSRRTRGAVDQLTVCTASVYPSGSTRTAARSTGPRSGTNHTAFSRLRPPREWPTSADSALV